MRQRALGHLQEEDSEVGVIVAPAGLHPKAALLRQRDELRIVVLVRVLRMDR